MLLNYLHSSLRNFFQNKLFSLINLGGLSVGLAASILIALYVQSETSYDKHWDNAAQLYRINTASDQGNGFGMGAGTSAAVLPALKLAFPDEILRGSRVMDFEREVAFGDFRLEEIVASVDRDFIEMFDFEVLNGDLSAALRDTSSMALSEQLAGRLFGNRNPIGEVLTLSLNGVSRDLRVAAVYRLPVGNTVLDLPALILLDEAALPAQIMTNWGARILRSYVQLAPGVVSEAIDLQLPSVIDRNMPATMEGIRASDRYRLDLQNVRDLHLQSAFDSTRAGGSSATVLAFSAIAVLVLLIGCINFTVLSTAKAAQRAHEVGVRKTIGASGRQLILQYLGESFVMVLPAMLLGLALVELLLPTFEAVVGTRLSMSWTSPRAYGALLLLYGAVALAGGFYPALVLSRSRPKGILKGGRVTEASAVTRAHGILTVFQFSIAIALMAATAVVYAQVSFVSNRDPGFNKDNLLVIDNLLLRADVAARKAGLKQAVDSLPNVIVSTFSGHQPTQQVGMANNVLPFTLSGDPHVHRLATLTVGHEFFSTYEIRLLAGRDYVRELDQPSRLIMTTLTDAGSSESNVLINASAARELGFLSPEAALGARIDGTMSLNQKRENLTVIGVVADTHFFSLNAAPRAEVYLLSPDVADVLSIRYRGDAPALVRNISAIWQELMGSAELSFSLVEQNMAGEFEQARTESRILVCFAALAIVIACLGLFGSATFNVERRTKEIGIRKAMGAEVQEIMRLLLWQFSKPVMLANLIAWPLALWTMLHWLQRFPYQIDAWLLLLFCALAGLAALLIAWLTVAGNTWRSANFRPVLALRYE